MITMTSQKKIYIHTVNEQIMNKSEYDDDSYIIVDLYSEADCYYKNAGNVELIDICDNVYEAVASVITTQYQQNNITNIV